MKNRININIYRYVLGRATLLEENHLGAFVSLYFFLFSFWGDLGEDGEFVVLVWYFHYLAP
jgi:hypothetical protein